MEKKPEISLSNFQAWMQEQLLNPSGVQALDVLSGERRPVAQTFVNDSKRLSASAHLAIYQRSYIARLRDCMCKVFSALEYALGEELFVAFADTYLESHPSSNYNLSNLGEQFADFLEATRPDAQEEVKEDWPDFMIELAKFEFAINTLFDQEDKSNHPIATLETKEENLGLVSVFGLYAFRFPIRPFYSAFVNDEKPDFPALQQSYCVIIRQHHNYRIALYDLKPAKYHFLLQMQSGKSVQEALAYMVAEMGVAEEQLLSVWKTWKETWINAGFFVDIS